MLLGLGVRPMVRRPLATLAFCGENCARLPPKVKVWSCHIDALRVLKSSCHASVNGPGGAATTRAAGASRSPPPAPACVLLDATEAPFELEVVLPDPPTPVAPTPVPAWVLLEALGPPFAVELAVDVEVDVEVVLPASPAPVAPLAAAMLPPPPVSAPLGAEEAPTSQPAPRPARRDTERRTESGVETSIKHVCGIATRPNAYFAFGGKEHRGSFRELVDGRLGGSTTSRRADQGALGSDAKT